MPKSIAGVALFILAGFLSLVGLALLAAAVQLGIDLGGAAPAHSIVVGEETLDVRAEELQVSLVLALVLGLLFLVPGFLFGRRGVRKLRGS